MCGLSLSCQNSRRTLDSTPQRQQVEDGSRSVSQSQSAIPLARPRLPDCQSFCLSTNWLSVFHLLGKLSRLREPVSAPSCDLLSSCSVGLSLEANAIARCYTKGRQLVGHAPSLLSASNMSVATKKYLRKNGLMEVVEEEEEGEKVWVEPQNEKLRSQGQLIQHQQLMGERRAETSVGNILDLSRLRQLPKLF